MISLEVLITEDNLRKCLERHLDVLDIVVAEADNQTWDRWKNRRDTVNDYSKRTDPSYHFHANSGNETQTQRGDHSYSQVMTEDIEKRQYLGMMSLCETNPARKSPSLAVKSFNSSITDQLMRGVNIDENGDIVLGHVEEIIESPRKPRIEFSESEAESEPPHTRSSIKRRNSMKLMPKSKKIKESQRSRSKSAVHKPLREPNIKSESNIKTEAPDLTGEHGHYTRKKVFKNPFKSLLTLPSLSKYQYNLTPGKIASEESMRPVRSTSKPKSSHARKATTTKTSSETIPPMTMKTRHSTGSTPPKKEATEPTTKKTPTSSSSTVNSKTTENGTKIRRPGISGKFYQCGYCERSFVRVDHLTSHVQKHMGQPRYACIICKKKFYSSSTLKSHVRCHPNASEKQMQASLIPISGSTSPSKGFNAKSLETDLEQKRKLIVPIERLSIPSNSVSLSSEKFAETDTGISSLQTIKNLAASSARKLTTKKSKSAALKKNAINTALTKKNELKCQYCEEVFTRGYNLALHEFKHTGVKPHKCDICQKGFLLLPYLNAHMKAHNGEKPYHCLKCGKGFIAKCGLTKHSKHCGNQPAIVFDPSAELENDEAISNMLASNVDQDQDSLPVELLNLPLESDIDLGYTITENEMDPEPEETENSQAIAQLMIAEDVNKPAASVIYTCDECGSEFDQPVHLAQHKEQNHGAVYSYVCEQCNQGYDSFTALVMHVRLRHEDSADYEMMGVKL